MVPFAVAGLIAWAVAGLVLLIFFRGWLTEHDHENWLWTCLAGFLWGFPGLRRHAAARRQPTPPPGELTAPAPRRNTGANAQGCPYGSAGSDASTEPGRAADRHRLDLAVVVDRGQLLDRRLGGLDQRLGVGAAAVVGADHPAVVRARRSCRRRRTPAASSRPAAGRSRRCRSGRRPARRWRSAPSGPWSPSYQRWAVSARPSRDITRARPRPSSQADLLDRRVVGEHVARGQPLVVGRGRQQVADAEVARLEPLLPGQPAGREQRVGAGQQHRLADRDVLAARHPGDGDGPPPAAVAGEAAVEVVGDQPFALGHDLAGGRRRRSASTSVMRGTGHLDGGGADLVETGGTGGGGPGHPTIVPHAPGRG